MSFGLKPGMVTRISEVFSRHPQLREVIIYGSRAKGTHRPGSDIDLTLIGDDLDLKLLNRLAAELDDLLLPYLFDLSIHAHIENPDLLDHISRVGKVFYLRDGKQDAD